MLYKEWIMSEGGPLILINTNSLSHWGGVLDSRMEGHAFPNDYEKACDVTGYLDVFSVGGNPTLIVGDAPLDTCFWLNSEGAVFMVRVWACEEDFDPDIDLQNLPANLFDIPDETTMFEVMNPTFIMFDSAEPGDDPDMKVVHVTLATGSYRILTRIYDIDASASLVLHRFDRLG